MMMDIGEDTSVSEHFFVRRCMMPETASKKSTSFTMVPIFFRRVTHARRALIGEGLYTKQGSQDRRNFFI
jgi:hypothetical protein